VAGSVMIQQPQAATVGAIVLAGAAAGLAVLFHSQRLPLRLNGLRRSGRATRSLFRQPGKCALLAALTLLLWLNNTLVLGCLLRSVDVHLRPELVLSAAPAGFLAGALPITLAGIGTRDGALILLLSPFTERSKILAASFLYTAFAYWFLALIGLAVMGRNAISQSARLGEGSTCP